MVVYFFMYLISSLRAAKIKKIVIKVIKSTNATPFPQGRGQPSSRATFYYQYRIP